jgi:hypothetical protein
VLLLAFYLLVKVKMYSQAMDYTTLCRYVMGSEMSLADDTQLLDGMDTPCPGMLRRGGGGGIGGSNSSSDYSQLYRNAYTALLPSASFPRVGGTSVADELLLPYHHRCARWSEWHPSRQGTTANCHRVDGAGERMMLYSGGDMDSMCYACVCSLPEFEDSLVAQYGDDYCTQFDEQADGARIWKIVAAVWVVTTNQLLKLGIRKTAPWLKSHTLEFQLMSQATRVFICQLSNTAILSILLKSSLGPFISLPGSHYPTINPKWYAEVAAPVVITMIIQFVIPWGIHALTWFMERRVRTCRAHSQNALNARFTPGEFDIAGSYGEVLLAMWVTFIFGSGVPILYWVATVGFAIRFCVDKLVVLRLYKRPPMYSEKLIERFDTLALLAVLFHAVGGCIMLAYAGGTNPTSLSKFLPLAPHMAPMLGALAITACAVVLKVLVSPAVEQRLQRSWSVPLWLRFLVCQHGRRTASYDSEKLRPFSEARQLGEIANAEYSYHAPTHAQLEELQQQFRKKLQAEMGNRALPLLRHGLGGTNRMNCMSSSVYAPVNREESVDKEDQDDQEATYKLLLSAVNGVD